MISVTTEIYGVVTLDTSVVYLKMELGEIFRKTVSLHLPYVIPVCSTNLLLFTEWCKEGLQEVQTFQGCHS